MSEYTGNNSNWVAGKGTLAMSIIALAASGLEAVGGMLTGRGNGGGGGGNGGGGDCHLVTREMADKDAKIAKLEGMLYTNEQVGKVKDEQYQVNLEQAVLNGTTAATLECMQNTINDFKSLTKTMILASSVESTTTTTA